MCIRPLDSAFSTNECPAMPQHKPRHKPSTLRFVTLQCTTTTLSYIGWLKIKYSQNLRTGWLYYVSAYSFVQLKDIWTKFGTDVCKGLPKHLCKYRNKIHCDCQVIINYRPEHFILSHPEIIVCQPTARFVFTVSNFYSFLPLKSPYLFQNGCKK